MSPGSQLAYGIATFIVAPFRGVLQGAASPGGPCIFTDRELAGDPENPAEWVDESKIASITSERIP